MATDNNVVPPNQVSDQANVQPQVAGVDGERAQKQPRLTSNVWEHFIRVTTKDNEIVAICKYCKKEYAGASKNGTTHLRRHMEACPCRTNNDINKYLVVDDEPGGTKSVKHYKFDNTDLRRCIALFIVEGSHAFSMVEERGFRRMLSRANPLFNAFSRRTLKRELMSMYNSEIYRVREMILSANSHVCLTTDNWRNEFTREEYMCVTSHFVDSNWVLQKRIVSFKALTPPYNGQCIADELCSCLSEWNIEDKVLTVTVDNASYNDTMITNVRGRLLAKKCLVQNGEFFQVRCCAHIVNLIVQSGLDLIKGSLDKIRETVKYVCRSPKRSKQFFEIAEKNFHLRTLKKFRLDMPIRWNSTYLMLGNVLYYKDALVYYSVTDSAIGCYALTSLEWENVDRIHKFLKVFYDVTCMFSAVKSPTSNLYFRGVFMIHKTLFEVANGESSILSAPVSAMLEKFNKYWGEYNEILSCAAILDPRCKEKFLMYCYDKLYGKGNGADHVQKVVSKLQVLFQEYKNSSTVCCSNVVDERSICNNGSGDELFSDYTTYVSQISQSVDKTELDHYLAEPPRELSEELDVLDFWHKSSMRYPDLARMACDLLSIPVSTVASESAFSTSGNIITSVRSSLKPDS